MSGLVHLSSLEDDFYLFDTERSQLVGRRSRCVIRLGDRVQVQVAKVDSFKKQVDFRLVTDGRNESKRPEKGRESGSKQPWTPAHQHRHPGRHGRRR